MIDRIRIGVLGAARIAPGAPIKLARFQTKIDMVAVAARDAKRAKDFVTKHEIPKVRGSYDELTADPDIDASTTRCPRPPTDGLPAPRDCRAARW